MPDTPGLVLGRGGIAVNKEEKGSALTKLIFY